MATIVGVFTSRDQAEKAVRELRGKGLTDREISIVAKDTGNQGRGGRRDDMEVGDLGTGDSMAEGATWGGALGGIAGLLAGVGALAIPGIGPIVAAGPLAATLSGAVTGGIAGGLLDLGIPEAEGRQYEEQVKQGKILAVVECADQKLDDAANVLRQNGAQDVRTYQKSAGQVASRFKNH